MHIFYIIVTILTACMNLYAASLDLVGAESVKAVADRVEVAHRWMVPLGILLLSGGVGLLVGFAVRPLGVAAAIGLILYFICAVSAHVRVRDREVAGAIVFLLLAIASLVANLGYRHQW
jgi:uncharacterized membrane protein HdeD (DUF308 family)